MAYAFDETVNKVDLRVTETIGVGDVKFSGVGDGIDTGGTAGLQLHHSEKFLEVRSGREKRDGHDGASAETRAQIGGASEDVSEMVVLHKRTTILFENFFDNFGCVCETLEDGVDVVALLHRHDTHLILLVAPDEEILVFVLEDTTGIGPVATASRGQQKGRVGLLEEIAVVA